VIGTRAQDLSSRVIGSDRGRVAVADAPRRSRAGERLIDVACAVQLGERDGSARLAPNPTRAGRSGGDQAALGAGSDGQKGLLVGAARAP
jgi:hypothetical protein